MKRRPRVAAGRSTRSGIVVVRPGAGQRIARNGATMTVKASAKSSGRVLTCIETLDPPGYRALPHIHRHATEAFYVLEGTYSFETRAQRRRCTAGSFVLVRPNTLHGYRSGRAGGRLLIIYSPAGLDELFRALAASRRASDQNKTAARFGTVWLERRPTR